MSLFWSRAANDTLNDAQMSLLLAAGCLPQSSALFGFHNSIFFLLQMLNYEVQETTWMRQNENAHSVIWRCQCYDSPGDSLFPAVNIGSLSTCLVTAL